MRLLYVAVALVSALMGYVALEAKPIDTKSSVKVSRPVLQTREIVTRQTEYYEPEPVPVKAPSWRSSCCPGNPKCTNSSCSTGKTQCSGKTCGCGK